MQGEAAGRKLTPTMAAHVEHVRGHVTSATYVTMQPHVAATIALAMGISFAGLARWSDTRTIQVRAFQWFMPDGVAGCFARRKNSQYEAKPFYLADTKRKWSLVGHPRRYLSDLGYTVPQHGRIPEAELKRLGNWLFRDIRQTSVRNGAQYIEYDISGDG